jgi:hypothetical protein
MKYLIILVALPLFGQTPNIHATAQCEAVNTNVLGITSLQDCDIGVTNYSSGQITVTQAMFREWFPTLDIEDAARAQAVGDKAFNSSKTSKIIAAINFVSPLAVALMGGGFIRAGVEAIAAVSLANTAAQAYKNHLISLQPSEAAFLPNCAQSITLAPYGTTGFSQVCTVLGSINYTNSPVVLESSRKAAKIVRGPGLVWNGDLPVVPVVAPAPPRFAPGAYVPAARDGASFEPAGIEYVAFAPQAR